MNFRKLLTMGMTVAIVLASMTGCSSSNTAATASAGQGGTLTVAEITEKAKAEGQVVSVGMPDSWANWKDTWEDLNKNYGLTHVDTDMSSAEEIAKFEAEKSKPTADIGDVGIAFAPVAVEKGVTQPYKPTHWEEIPDWAKDQDGHWMLGYTGTIAFISNKKLISNPPKSWEDVLNGDYTVAIGDVGKAAQANSAVLACALAHGGDENNLEPAYAYFAKLAEQGRLSFIDPSIANLEKGEVELALMWDFNALNYRDTISKDDFEVTIPKEGSVISGYATIINKYAPHPYAAMLAREYILSDAGQINLAKGYARPIRTSVELPEEVKAIMLPQSQYENAKPINDYSAWDTTSKTIPQDWQSKVLINIK
ncbi:ABC transporter substrate-binding protein [Fusibacter sp. 3D3]|uniref:ABC transporter substrate-binding protein n=1 Tax=Fusibacter sp. 3D3 TaxID=1048380 RepID=UPI000852C037|nr:extracellular solute-binding protein [Fusibacter sp. 3D3]GAU79566.1 ferric iron ABC transporter, iron-binding protein [Fusibacter sp. 3D3]